MSTGPTSAACWSYLVVYDLYNWNQKVGGGNHHILVAAPITSIEQVRDIEKLLLTKIILGATVVVITNWKLLQAPGTLAIEVDG